jgi:hypothetical protein
MRLWERIKAWKRKETMLAGTSRGRCFTKKDAAPLDGANKATAKAEAKLTQIKITRTDGTEETIAHG